MLTNMDEEGVKVAVLDLINQVYKIGRIPEKSRMAEITPIPKANRPNSSRPISLLEVISKLKERMVKPRLKHKVGDLSEVILGYTDRVGTSEVLPTTISEISEVIKQKGQTAAIIVFLNLAKAFEIVSQEVILEQLVWREVGGHLLAYVSELLSNRSTAVKVQYVTSEYMPLEKGTPRQESFHHSSSTCLWPIL